MAKLNNEMDKLSITSICGKYLSSCGGGKGCNILLLFDLLAETGDEGLGGGELGPQQPRLPRPRPLARLGLQRGMH